MKLAIVRISLWVFYSFSSLLLCLWLAWHLLAQANFFYPTWYSLLNIEQTIQQIVPQNTHKPLFEFTDTDEHNRLFAAMVEAIHQKGDGLATIKFQNAEGKVLDTLLTSSEVVHLQDVAHLIDQLNWFSVILLLLSLLILATLFVFRISMPKIKRLLLSISFTVSALVVLVLLSGPKKIFYWLHTQIFPKDHQWFFYYEESLMSLLMKAPDLFAPIAILLIVLALSFWSLHIYVLKKLGV